MITAAQARKDTVDFDTVDFMEIIEAEIINQMAKGMFNTHIVIPEQVEDSVCKKLLSLGYGIKHFLGGVYITW